MKVFKKGPQTDADLHAWLSGLLPQARVGESGYAVSAVFRVRYGAAEDYYFAGVNVENVDHRLSTHGEEGAMAAMIAGLGKGAEIVEGWVMGAPRTASPDDPEADNLGSCCGKCRQQIAGLAHEDAIIHTLSFSGLRRAGTTVATFLPDVFTFRNFRPDFAPAPVSAPPADIAAQITRQGPLTKSEIEGWLKSLAPVDYDTGVAQAALLELENGAFVAGARIEDAAYLDVSAVQCAAAIAAAEHGDARVRGVWIYTTGKPAALPLSALQVLSECAESENIPVRYLNGGAETTLAAHLPAPTSRRP